jgi:hypothetical protein
VGRRAILARIRIQPEAYLGSRGQDLDAALHMTVAAAALKRTAPGSLALVSLNEVERESH